MTARQGNAYVVPTGEREDGALGGSDDMQVGAERRASVGLGKPQALCTLGWLGVSYTVTRGSKSKDGARKAILKNVTGRCGAGELTAVMGPSGCGKTTLLDILADRVRTGSLNGTIALNGQPRKAATFRTVARYVAQEDSLFGCFTVEETLQMAANLTIPHSPVYRSLIHSRVPRVMREMGLQSCAHTYVGDIFRKGISGGQKRRLSIAIELLSNPSILLLDEPTSGLDSSATHNLMKLLVSLCQQGRTILCTIHQPSSLVYDTFTNILILAKGETVYFGPRIAMISYFSTLGYACPAYSNPSEYFIGLVNADFEGHSDIPPLVAAYSSSAIAKDVLARIQEDQTTPSKPLSAVLEKPTSFWQQFYVLLHRNSVKNIRNPGIYAVRLVMYLILATCVGTMYLKTNKRISDNDIVVLLFGVHAFFVFNSVAVVPFFIQERAIFLRERGNSSLQVSSFVLANFLAGIPGIFSISLTASVVVVALSGLKSFGWYLLNMFLSLVAAESMMHVLGAIANDGIVGIALGASLFGMSMLCEGFMVPRDSIPGYWIWVHYLGFNTYGFQAFIKQQFYDATGAASAIPLAVARLGVEDVSVAANMGILAAFAAGFELAFAAILFKVHTGRR